MLRAWTTPLWALIGALLGVFEFGPLSQWMNSYWGGAVAACAGCLVFGSLPRLRSGLFRERGRTRDAALLGAGLGVHMLARPFESVLLSLCVVLYFVPVALRRPACSTGPTWRLAKAALVAVLAASPAIALMFAHDREVTGSGTTLPYALSRYQYGMPAAFTVQPNPVPHRELTREQDLDYRAQSAVHGDGTDTIRDYLSRLMYRVRFYRFFFLAPLYLALPAFVFALGESAVGESAFLWPPLWAIVFALGTNFYPYFYPHYIAALTCIFLLISVTALERLSRWRIRGSPVGKEIARAILFLCAAQFLFWYGIHLSASLSGSPRMLEALGPYETWDYINYGDPRGRIAINRSLAQAPGKQLVFVRYGPRHLFDEWIHNAADVDASHVVFAGDLGAVENEALRRYYPDRAAWILEPDAHPPQLTPYPATPQGASVSNISHGVEEVIAPVGPEPPFAASGTAKSHRSKNH